MTLLLMTCLQELFFRPVSSDALLQTHFFRHILPDASKLQIKFICSWTCSIRIFMNSTLIMHPVHLNKLFSISNWWFLIPCYHQNLRGDFEKHPLFQHIRMLLDKVGESCSRFALVCEQEREWWICSSRLMLLGDFAWYWTVPSRNVSISDWLGQDLLFALLFNVPPTTLFIVWSMCRDEHSDHQNVPFVLYLGWFVRLAFNVINPNSKDTIEVQWL